jgi:GT2 family glycosyltransferase
MTITAGAPDVSVVTVSFNTAGVLRRAMVALQASEGVRFEATVVDNASADGSAEVIAREYPAVTLIRNAVNRGFAAASNQGLAIARGRYLLLLNPDTAVPPSALATLVRFMDEHPRVGICGPRLLLGDGTLQSCGRTFPTVGSVLRQSRSFDRLARTAGAPDTVVTPSSEPAPCDWVDGACLMIRRETFDEIGPLDERFFLFAEEMDWCHSARDRGWPVYAVPGVSVMHLRGESTRQRERESTALLVQMTLTYFQKRRGVVVAALVALILSAGFVKQLSSDRAVARAKLSGVRRWAASLGGATPPLNAR